MSRNRVGALVALCMLGLPVSAALGQRFFGGTSANGPDISRPGQVSDDADGMCNGTPGGSRIRPNCDAVATARMRAEANKVPVVPPIVPQCQASTEIAYTQRQSAVHLDGSILVTSCPAGSTGAYTIVLTVKKEGGETTLELAETWPGNDGPTVKFTADYPIGDGAELADVRLRDLTCTCAEPTPPAESAPEQVTSPGTE
ncbi:MAG TPA: hypothetical protein VFX89_20740 [Gammaproteobacteria bacterium]|nr:hypothetical protein [Gammaproteobacteria bacterium]